MVASKKKVDTEQKVVSMGPQLIQQCAVVFSHLNKPDMEYNSGHSVTIKVTKELKDLHKEMKAQTGVNHINGLKSDDEDTELASFKTKIHSNDGIQKFPKTFDLEGQACSAPSRGDIVNIIFQPKVWNVNNKDQISCYLNEIQVVERNSESSITFEKPGSTEASFEKPTENSKEDLPF